MKVVVGKIINILAGIVGFVMLAIVLYFIFRVFILDVFPVNTLSMSPTINAGDRVVVNKLIFGSRIYSNLDFLSGGRMESFRVKGIRKIQHNDVIVFNHTRFRDIKFTINNVYVKRCIGLPGDTISIERGIYKNSSLHDTLGLLKEQEGLNDAELHPLALHAMSYAYKLKWTVKEFGPLYIPRAGDAIELTVRNILLYARYIQYEQGERFNRPDKSTITIDGRQVSHYKFESNYYFMAGDNVFDSHDSRYFGLIPEEFIIGVTPAIIYSRDSKGKIRWNRIWKQL